MVEKSIAACEMNEQLWDTVARNDDWIFDESSLHKLIEKYLFCNQLSELLSVLCKIILECNSNYHAIYKTTIIMKYLCIQYPQEFPALLVDQSNFLETIRNYSYIDYYGKNQGLNVRINAEQLLDFIESKKKSGESGKATIIDHNSLDSATNQLLQTLRSISTINRASILENVRSEIIQFNKFLPGPITPEKYSGLDKTPQIDDILYGKIVERVIDIFDDNWPVTGNDLESAIERLIVIEGASFSLFNESLTALTVFIKESERATVVKSLVIILEKLLKSQALFSCITDICKPVKKVTFESAEIENTWQRILQILVSLPNRIANKLVGKIADCFLPDNYAKLISFHIGQAIKFLHFIQRKLDIQPNIKMISMLISKAVIVLGAQRFEDLFDLMSEWCCENPDNIRQFINGILRNIDRRAIQPIAVIFLMHEEPTFLIDKVFGDLLTIPDWKHIFTVKIPLMSFHKGEVILRNLIAYLSNSSDDKSELRELLIKSLDIWGDRSAMNHTCFEQHEYITKLIVLSIQEVKASLQPSERDLARKLVFSGTSAHLESTQTELRALGMITGEIVIENLVTSDDEPKLRYDYDGMSEEARELVGKMRDLATIAKQEEKLSEETRCAPVRSLISSDLICTKLYDLGVNCGIVANTATHSVLNLDSLEHALSDDNKEFPKLDITRANKKLIDQTKSQDEDQDLDSDDDLVPYDLSNDTPASGKLRPRFLRDFKENLINAQSNTDPNILDESMKAGEELILTQLSNDDPSFSIELLEILISLREISCVDNFELLKFKCCVAIAVTYPKEAAKYLANEFHKKMGQYSIKDRLFILNVLGDAARKLSKIDVKQEEVDVKRAKQAKLKRQVEKRVSLAIDINNTKKYETLYDDDFEVVSKNNNSTNDWEEIVNRRITANTRIFAHPSKMPITTVNKFNDVASSFFYPLLYGFRQKETCMYNTPTVFEDQENILLVNYLKTLSTIIMAAENCIIMPKMAKEILDLAWTLRYHNQAKVRLCIIENVASVVITLPKEGLTSELMELIFEFRAWLDDISDDGFRGDPDSNCRALGKNVVALIDAIFYSTLNDI